MLRHQIPQVTMNRLRLEFIRGNYCAHRLAKELKLSTITTWRYGKEFERIKAEYPEKLKDLSFYIPEPPKPHRETPLYVQLMQVLPDLILSEKPGTKLNWFGKNIMCFTRRAILIFLLRIFIISGWRNTPVWNRRS